MNFLSERESIRRYFYEKYGLFVHVRRPDVTEQIRKKGAFLLNLVHSTTERKTAHAICAMRTWSVYYYPPFVLDELNTPVDDELNATAVMSEIEQDLMFNRFIQGYEANFAYPALIADAVENTDSLLLSGKYDIVVQGVYDNDANSVASKPISIDVGDDEEIELQFETLSFSNVNIYMRKDNSGTLYLQEEELEVVPNGYKTIKITDFTTALGVLDEDYLYNEAKDVYDYENDIITVRAINKRIHMVSTDMNIVEGDYSLNLKEADENRTTSTSYKHNILILNTETSLSRAYTYEGEWLIQAVSSRYDPKLDLC